MQKNAVFFATRMPTSIKYPRKNCTKTRKLNQILGHWLNIPILVCFPVYSLSKQCIPLWYPIYYILPTKNLTPTQNNIYMFIFYLWILCKKSKIFTSLLEKENSVQEWFIIAWEIRSAILKPDIKIHFLPFRINSQTFLHSIFYFFASNTAFH